MCDGKYIRLINFVTLIEAEHFYENIVLHEANGCYCFPLPVGTNNIDKLLFLNFPRYQIDQFQASFF